jgi:hypothetical protein
MFFYEAGGAMPLLDFYLIFKNKVCTRVFSRYIKGNKENIKDYIKPSSIDQYGDESVPLLLE